MELKDIVSISGTSGLHKVIGKSKNGLIVETIGQNRRFATSYQDKVSVLEDISMYTTEGDVRLAEVFVKINTAGNVPTPKDDAKTQRAFLVTHISLDSERVYDSDIKKLFNWYNALKDLLDFSTLLAEPTTEEESIKATAEENATTAEKPKAKKATKKAKETTDEEPVKEAKPKATRKKKTEE